MDLSVVRNAALSLIINDSIVNQNTYILSILEKALLNTEWLLMLGNLNQKRYKLARFISRKNILSGPRWLITFLILCFAPNFLFYLISKIKNRVINI